MTKEELIQNNWEPRECRIDTLYFKNGYFIHLIGEKARVFSTTNDMVPLGEAETIEEINSIQKSFERFKIKTMEKHVKDMKKTFEKQYGEKV